MISGLLTAKTAMDPWQFPAGFYDTSSAANAYARRMMRRAIAERSWKAAWEQEEYRSILDSPGDIFVSDRTRFYPAKAVLWRLNRLHIQMAELCFENKCLSMYEVLVEEMFGRLWFCVSILADDAWFGGHNVDDNNWARKVLNAQILWLPELIILGPRIANYVPAEVSWHLWRKPAFRYQWALGLHRICHALNHPFDIPSDGEDAEWDLIEELVSKGIIERSGGRFALRI